MDKGEEREDEGGGEEGRARGGRKSITLNYVIEDKFILN